MTGTLNPNGSSRTTFLVWSGSEALTRSRPLPESWTQEATHATTAAQEARRAELRREVRQPAWEAVLKAARFISALKRILGGFVGVPDAALPEYSVARLEDLAYTKALSLRSLAPSEERLLKHMGFGQKLIEQTARHLA